MLAVREEAGELGLRWRLLLDSWYCTGKRREDGWHHGGGYGFGGRAYVGGGASGVQGRGSLEQHCRGKVEMRAVGEGSKEMMMMCW